MDDVGTEAASLSEPNKESQGLVSLSRPMQKGGSHRKDDNVKVKIALR